MTRDQELLNKRLAAKARSNKGYCQSCVNKAEPGKVRCSDCTSKICRRGAERRAADKINTINRYGGKCVTCGETRSQFLTIDHVSGGGKKHRKEAGYGLIFTFLRQNDYPTGYEVVCWNHNFLRHISKAKPPQTASARYVRESNRKLKVETFEKYGGPRCACCGLEDITCLTLDHSNGGGEEHRRSLGVSAGSNFYRVLRQQGFPEGYTVLCFNCNCGKSVNGGVCPHTHVD